MLTIALAILKRVPMKDWVYLGVILAALIGGVVFVQHERSVGARAAEQKLTELKAQYEQVAKVQAAKDAQMISDLQQHTAQLSTQLSEKVRSINETSSTNRDLLKRISLLTMPHSTSGSDPSSTTPRPSEGGVGQSESPVVPADMFSIAASRAVEYAEQADSCQARLTTFVEFYTNLQQTYK